MSNMKNEGVGKLIESAQFPIRNLPGEGLNPFPKNILNGTVHGTVSILREGE